MTFIKNIANRGGTSLLKYTAYSRTSPLKKECEDSYAINTDLQLFGVFDGVTPIDDYKNESGHNGARVASYLFKQYFEQKKEITELKNVFIEANRQLQDEMKANHRWDLDNKHLLWSTCGVALLVTETNVHFAQVGDCMALCSDEYGDVTMLTHDTVKNNYQRAKLRWESDRKKGLPVPPLDTAYQKQAYGRSMANTQNGYSVANGMDEMAHYVATGSIPRKGLKYVLIVSDGMFHPEQKEERVLTNILTDGIAEYAKSLEIYERNNGRHIDDKTGILLEFI